MTSSWVPILDKLFLGTLAAIVAQALLDEHGLIVQLAGGILAFVITARSQRWPRW